MTSPKVDISLRLIIAATSGELVPLLERLERASPVPLDFGQAVRGCVHGVPLVLATLGVGKVNTAAGLALAIKALEPSAVVQIGIGGAFGNSGLEVGAAAIASEEVHLDSGALTATGFEDMEVLGFPLLTSPREHYNRIPVDRDLSRSIAGDTHPMLPFGTSETVTGTPERLPELASRYHLAVESMEGAAAAQVSLALGVPFAEVRGVSNVVGEREKARWKIAEGLTAAHQVLTRWLIGGAPIAQR